MKLRYLQYTEFNGDEKEWKCDGAEFENFNLIVGRNSSGKTRLINVIWGLARLISAELKPLFSSGTFNARFISENHEYVYQLQIENRKVVTEKLIKDKKLLLDRKENGKCSIYFSKLKKSVSLEVPVEMLAAHARRDPIQHPFFEELYQWASNVRFFPFGTPMGRDHLMLINTSQEAKSSPATFDANQVTKIYQEAYKAYGKPFDRAILSDMKALGYSCSAVGLAQLPAELGVVNPPVAALFVKERELKGKTFQTTMSQGMFRALSLIIQLRSCALGGGGKTLLIDDIGEGLDFSRSKAFIDLLVELSNSHDLQFLMTTNDRFIMNGVPLNYWSVAKRSGSSVSLITRKNSRALFEEFEMLGLNNFDFYSNDFYVKSSN